MKKVFIILATIASLASCKKEDAENNNNGNGNNNNSNNNNNNTNNNTPLSEAWRIGEARFEQVRSGVGNMSGQQTFYFYNNSLESGATSILHLTFAVYDDFERVGGYFAPPVGFYPVVEGTVTRGAIAVRATEKTDNGTLHTIANATETNAPDSLKVQVIRDGDNVKIIVPKLTAHRGADENGTEATTIEANVIKSPN